MKEALVKTRRRFQPALGVRPLRVKVGIGSFLTFEFGPRTKSYGHLQAQWRLWIYLSNWTLFHGKHQLIDSNSDRQRMSIVARRLEEEASLTDVQFDPHKPITTFFFNDFRLVVSPADYLENAENRDEYWMFFMPKDEVLAMGPSGIHVEHANLRDSAVNRKKQEIQIHSTEARRQIRVED